MAIATARGVHRAARDDERRARLAKSNRRHARCTSAGAMKTIGSVAVFMMGLAACTVGENDEAVEATAGASVSEDYRLTGCRGRASSDIPSNGRYIITTFGGPGDHQPMSCGGYANGTTWYAASRQRYGCGSKLKVEANGKCAVVEALDYGPDVCVERAANAPIIDVSPKLSRHLFGLSGAGYSDRLFVTVTEVSETTPTGPCVAQDPSTPPPTGTAQCTSATLGRNVDTGTCVQDATDAGWYECQNGNWVSRSSSTGCASAYGFCESATLGRAVPPRTCVQARSDGEWYQCNGQSWVTPVDTGARSGPIGSCATWNPL